MDIVSVVSVAIGLLDYELDITRMELEHPEYFPPELLPKPLAEWAGSLAQLLELITALTPAKLFRTPDGRPMNLAEVASIFEQVLGLKINDLYGRKTRLLTRKKNESPFLESLLYLYRREVEKMSE